MNTAFGKIRAVENTPRLKTICHSPGSIHSELGDQRARAKAMSTPAVTAGRNCSIAD